MPTSDSIPVPVMTSMSLPFNLLITLNNHFNSRGTATNTLPMNLTSALFIRGNRPSLTGKEEILYIAVSPGPAQKQQNSAVGSA
jgi:hypothetical protein